MAAAAAEPSEQLVRGSTTKALAYLQKYGCIRTTPWHEYVAPIPKEFVEKSAGLAFDIGGSSGKCVFCCKDPSKCALYVDPSRETIGHLHLIQFDRFSDAATDELLEYLRERADVTRGSTVYSTGAATATLQHRLQDMFGVTLVIKCEVDCVCAALEYLLAGHHGDLRFTDWVLAPDRRVEEDTVQYLAPYVKGVDPGAGPLLPEYQKEDRLEYPAYVLNMGSGFGHYLMPGKGKEPELSVVYCNGVKTFIGLTKVLTGAKDHQEIIEMAERGDSSKVDESLHQFIPQGDDPFYAAYRKLPDIRYISFGRITAGTAEEYTKDDLAKAMVDLTVQNATLSMTMNARAKNVVNVFILGGLASYPIVRKEMMKAFILQALVTKYHAKEQVVRPYFMRYPAVLGAVGAMLYSWTDVPTTNMDSFCSL